jgi:hypothetical protein
MAQAARTSFLVIALILVSATVAELSAPSATAGEAPTPACALLSAAGDQEEPAARLEPPGAHRRDEAVRQRAAGTPGQACRCR